jgi:orotidine-5'-phosphate decarboxylase
MQLYTAEGPAVVRELVAAGRKVFLDLKYHDIPNTVASAVKEAIALGVSMLTVHASGGSKMLRGAVEVAKINPSLVVLAVSVLTSMDEANLHEISVPGTVEKQVLALGKLALECGCQGLVSSAKEAPTLRKAYGDKFALVTPGVRPAGVEHGDQARVLTPAQALKAGASHLVVGRPITAAKDPASEARAILNELAGATTLSV